MNDTEELVIIFSDVINDLWLCCLFSLVSFKIQIEVITDQIYRMLTDLLQKIHWRWEYK